MALDKMMMLRMLANAMLSNNAVDMDGNPMIDIQSEGEGPFTPQWMDMNGNISVSDFSRGMDENGMPLVDWHTQNIADLGDENTPELTKLYKLLRAGR